MHFLPDVWVACEACGGRRFTPETLAVKFRGKTIADVLDMSIDDALDLFASVPKIRKVLQTLHDVGLGYVPLGQAAPTLSGGEAQRVKLAAELARPDTGKTLYVLDEPTTGLHLDDVRKLLDVVHRLADLGNTVVIIEHNLEVIKTADWLIDMGPEAGLDGGEVVAEGTARIRLGLAAEPHRRDPQGRPRRRPASPNAPGSTPRPPPRRRSPRLKKPSADAPTTTPRLQAPWEVDGRRWHTRDRTSRNGKPARWDGRALERVVDAVHALGDFAPTDWSQRSLVKITGLAKDAPVFFTATTGHEWVLTLRFSVPRNTFKQATLEAQFRLRPSTRARRPCSATPPGSA